mmetsp:Transcript_9387/g.28032  ORF Transcript_9387/g.28032 Transcript_9387/m.28032 type:complete len:214 (+) Transcript_9387:119-760(+)
MKQKRGRSLSLSEPKHHCAVSLSVGRGERHPSKTSQTQPGRIGIVQDRIPEDRGNCRCLASSQVCGSQIRTVDLAAVEAPAAPQVQSDQAPCVCDAQCSQLHEASQIEVLQVVQIVEGHCLQARTAARVKAFEGRAPQLQLSQIVCESDIETTQAVRFEVQRVDSRTLHGDEGFQGGGVPHDLFDLGVRKPNAIRKVQCCQVRAIELGEVGQA